MRKWGEKVLSRKRKTHSAITNLENDAKSIQNEISWKGKTGQDDVWKICRDRKIECKRKWGESLLCIDYSVPFKSLLPIVNHLNQQMMIMRIIILVLFVKLMVLLTLIWMRSQVMTLAILVIVIMEKLHVQKNYVEDFLIWRQVNKIF